MTVRLQLSAAANVTSGCWFLTGNNGACPKLENTAPKNPQASQDRVRQQLKNDAFVLVSPADDTVRPSCTELNATRPAAKSP